jgi:hypothetical protein
VLPHALRFKRPLHHCNACNPTANAKAELNRRRRACEVLAGTEIPRREKCQERGCGCRLSRSTANIYALRLTYGSHHRATVDAITVMSVFFGHQHERQYHAVSGEVSAG